MPQNIFYRIIDWPYHPNMIMTLVFIACFFAAMQGDGPIWAALIAASIGMPFAVLLLFAPYAISVWVIAVLFSLLQAIQARL